VTNFPGNLPATGCHETHIYEGMDDSEKEEHHKKIHKIFKCKSLIKQSVSAIPVGLKQLAYPWVPSGH
jgi:hypothetical protein